MSKPKVLISQVGKVTDIKRWNLKGVESCRKKIFGYVQNLPGENNWVKPLIGKSMQNYYFPSKYLHLDFNLKEYLRMQTVRFNRKEIDDSLVNLQKCINLIIENKDIVDTFLSNISKEILLENQSLRDFYSLYLTIFPSNKFKQHLSFDDIKELNLQSDSFSWFDFDPHGCHLGAGRNGENINSHDFCAQGVSGNGQRVDSGDGEHGDNGDTVHGKSKGENLQSALGEREGIEVAPLTQSHQGETNGMSLHEETWIRKKNYKKIIFSRTRKTLHFKKIICREENKMGKCSQRENEYDEKIYYLDCDVNIGLEELKEKNISDMEEEERSKSYFYNLINENENLKKTFSIRNRFIDPLYLRRRYSFIDKLTKKKIKKEKYKTYRKHFIQHADEKKVWPDNKGLLNKVYPNPYS
ncbi:conserved Plasmodium protein, unknown function [Plasmodium ovale]|uniref:Uncharacterized protein n=2 Tax=Plasmodium ovale TaxID=36330 RepID=A0A1A8W7T2_PLAOA|nr:conserved Plasmodium protein, unknown function [Plasmodium ovale curtisi]SBS98595.1 conserved Plasmodium protein, unknown function [Plasmodium ovale curtisi]SCQ17226.1 conserved Plasmodium protein, unknown function [Plasmodium ovale]